MVLKERREKPFNKPPTGLCKDRVLPGENSSVSDCLFLHPGMCIGQQEVLTACASSGSPCLGALPVHYHKVRRYLWGPRAICATHCASGFACIWFNWPPANGHPEQMHIKDLTGQARYQTNSSDYCAVQASRRWP